MMRGGAAMSILQVDSEVDYNVLRGEPVVRIRFRRPPTRRWSKFVVHLQDGQTIGDIMNNAQPIAEAYEQGVKDSRRKRERD
jgi:hypothetical protein